MANFLRKPRFFIFTFIIAILAVTITLQLSRNTPALLSGSSSAETILSIPTLVSVKEATYKSEVHSPDGTMKVVMKKTSKTQTSATFTFTVSEVSGTNEKIIFGKTLGENQAMQIPDNSWSPDNKYLFLKEDDNRKLSFFVLRASGESFADGKEYIDVVPQFEDKKNGFKLIDITGWDSDNLLHVFTAKEDGAQGPSFWFDVDSRSFYILGSR